MTHGLIKRTVVPCMAAMAVAGAVYAGGPATVYVDDDWAGLPSGTDPDGAGPATAIGTDAFPALVAALAAVGDGGTINVAAGYYAGILNLPLAGLEITKPVSIVGPQSGVDPRPSSNSARNSGDTTTEAVFDGSGLAASVFIIGNAALTIRPSDVSISGINIVSNAGSDVIVAPGDGTFSPQTGISITYNIIEGGGDDGIQLRATDGAYIAYNYIFDTVDDEINVCCGSSNATIEFNQCVGGTVNGLNGSGGIYVYGPGALTTPTVFNHTISNNVVDGTGTSSRNAGIAVGASFDTAMTGVTVSGNVVSNNFGPAVYIQCGDVSVNGNVMYNNASSISGGEALGGVMVGRNVPNISITNNTIFGNGSTLPNSGGILVPAIVNAANVATYVVSGNSIYANRNFGVNNLSTGGGNLDARNNWWGADTGPSGGATDPCDGTTVANGSGDGVSTRVCFAPFVTGAEPTILYVAENGLDTNSGLTPADPLGTVQEGLNRIAVGGEVFVLPGTYYVPFTMKRTANVAAEDVTQPRPRFIVDDGTAGATIALTGQPNSTGANISGLSFVGGPGANRVGVHMDSGSTFTAGVLIACLFEGLDTGLLVEGSAAYFDAYESIFVGNGTALQHSLSMTTIESWLFSNVFVANDVTVFLGAGAQALVNGNHFVSQGNYAIVSDGADALGVSNNAFSDPDAAYFANNASAAILAVTENWFPSIIGDDITDSNPGDFVANGESITFGGAGSAESLTDNAPAAQFDSDADGIPDTIEVFGALSPFNPDSDSDGVPDGFDRFFGSGAGSPAGIPGFSVTLDSDGDGFVDWYENVSFTDAGSAMNYPALGDVTRDGQIDLGDAVRALQIINRSVALGLTGDQNPNNVTVAGNGIFSLNNALQILRFQNGSRTSLPAHSGIN